MAPRSAPSQPAPVAAAVAAPAVLGSAEELLDSLEAPPAPGEALPELGLDELPHAPAAEPEELELEELPGPELSLEAIEDEEIVEEDEIAPAPVYSALDEEPARGPVRGRGTVSTAPVSVELSADSGTTDIAIPVDVSLGNGTARVQLHIRLTLNLNLQR